MGSYLRRRVTAVAELLNTCSWTVCQAHFGECHHLHRVTVHLTTHSTSSTMYYGSSTWWIGTTVFCGTRNFEPSCGICPFPRNFYVFTEFCGIRYWTVIRGQIWHTLIEFGLLYCMYTWFHHEIHDCHSSSDGRNTENIELSLSEILPWLIV